MCMGRSVVISDFSCVFLMSRGLKGEKVQDKEAHADVIWAKAGMCTVGFASVAVPVPIPKSLRLDQIPLRSPHG